MEQTIKEVDIILVDSGSTDATVAIASQFPVTILHIDPEDFSFGRSLNLGCAAAKKEIQRPWSLGIDDTPLHWSVLQAKPRPDN